jgi:hypothetical protein
MDNRQQGLRTHLNTGTVEQGDRAAFRTRAKRLPPFNTRRDGERAVRFREIDLAADRFRNGSGNDWPQKQYLRGAANEHHQNCRGNRAPPKRPCA